MKDDTIEVIGTAQYTLRPVEYRLEARIEAPVEEDFRGRAIPVPYAAFGEAMDAVVAAVVAKGFPEDDIILDGTGGFGRWWGPRKMDYGQDNRLIFRSADAGAIMTIPVWLEGLDIGRLSLCLESQPVRHEDATEHEVAAFARALSNARAIAAAMVATEGRVLGDLIRARDMRLSGGLDEPEHDGIMGQIDMEPPSALEERGFGEDGERRSVKIRTLYRIGNRME